MAFIVTSLKGLWIDTCWLLCSNSCQAVIGLFASHLNQLSSIVLPQRLLYQPAPFPALFSDFSFKNLSRFSIKHFIFMASISDAKSFLCDSFMLVYVWSGTLLLSAMLFTRLLGGLKAEDLPDSFCFPHKHLTELKTTKSTHICPK